MSEQNCPECGHHIEEHNKITTFGNCSVRVDCGQFCPCTRTYESLVGEKESIIGCDCALWESNDPAFLHNLKHHPNCDGTGHHKKGTDGAEYWGMAVRGFAPPESDKDAQDAKPTLQLLVIDLGDSCVVKVEKGGLHRVWLAGSQQAIGNVTLSEGESALFCVPFTELREALDGEKPLPRIEYKGGSYDLFYKGDGHVNLSKSAFHALSNIARQDLLVQKTGDWMLLLDSHLPTAHRRGLPDIWRYKR